MTPILISDFTYELPEQKIALHPLPERDHSKLLVYKNGSVHHKIFSQLPDELSSDCTLFFNDTRVIPARLLFTKETGAAIEVFLLNPIQPSTIMAQALGATSNCTWLCAVGNMKRWSDNTVLRKSLGGVELDAHLIDRQKGMVEFRWTPRETTFSEILHKAGAIPLPPYIKRSADLADAQRYQTVYSHFEGAVAAPTAGLHFTDKVLGAMRNKGIRTDFLTLHVSAGTFMPVKSENALEHTMHQEQVIVKRSNIENLLRQDRKIIAVGTTAMRTLESLYWFGAKLARDKDSAFLVEQDEPYLPDQQSIDPTQSLKAILAMMDAKGLNELTGETAIYIVPGYEFKLCKGLITNFHQPGSTLLLLIAAFLGPEWKRIYNEALAHEYRFLSYGDSSLLLPDNT
ncbi:MAG TPA: S-adenosylmethionine:tRNA ribosyltransferase-isomerase [Cyclobacteriaceae bacterium]|nr:S-adenosylmethionine:tRNA ribosyltransferase-isomerase [Cyclobacteriaceae bacterium]